LTRVYLAGPMTGYPDLNRAGFQAAAAQLRAQGHEPVNPHDLPPRQHEGVCPDSYSVSDDGHSAACYLRPCLAALLGCEEVRLLPGWESSTGACRERAVAVWSGIPVTLFDEARYGTSGVGS
jgi:hypothetical protein